MEFSLWPGANQSWPDLLEVAEYADAGRWRSVYVADHFMPSGQTGPDDGGPMLEATALLGALAGRTARVRLAPLVLSMTYRHPAVLAKWAATLDHASGGRLTLGLGAGWQINEHEFYGLELGAPGERVDRFAEGLEVITGLLTRPATTVTGKYYQIADAPAQPKPVQETLPLLVGGTGPRMLRLVARYADEWNQWSTPDTYPANAERLDAACESVGRDPATVHRSTQAVVLLSSDQARIDELTSRSPMPVLAGSTERIADAIGRWGEQGVHEVIVPDRALGAGAERRDALDTLTGIFFR